METRHPMARLKNFSVDVGSRNEVISISYGWNGPQMDAESFCPRVLADWGRLV